MTYQEIKLRRIDKLDIIDSLLGYLEDLAVLIIQLKEKILLKSILRETASLRGLTAKAVKPKNSRHI